MSQSLLNYLRDGRGSRNVSIKPQNNRININQSKITSANILEEKKFTNRFQQFSLSLQDGVKLTSTKPAAPRIQQGMFSEDPSLSGGGKTTPNQETI